MKVDLDKDFESMQLLSKKKNEEEFFVKLGLIVSSRKESLQHFKQTWAHEHEPVKSLLDAVKCLPITIDVGTNNQKLLDDEFYIGLKQKRATGQEYAELLEEFMSAVKQNYGVKILVQFDIDFLFEDFANHNAFEHLSKYRNSHLVFNDDIQGTTSVVLAGLIASLKLVGDTLADHTFLFLGTGEKKTPVEENHKKTWLVDSKGLIGRAIFASGSPFDPVEYNGKLYVPGHANNAYIFPGFGLGIIMSGTIPVHDDMLLAAYKSDGQDAREDVEA
ncbi:hypothetical protein POM88_007405 [Heracleum sosnowskyi]|uniref:Malic enzyme N-terminal domain-containing protein n=1 Tax=Heracleum sosnowskyi TaxID=360622 RepID=A0AAD8J7U3_9APIA|nr:hypothetical protein POM88_007405 [Heracleum sosnowskyi]